MQFRLSYMTKDFHFGNAGDAEIKVTGPDKEIEVVYKKRPIDSVPPPHEANDGLIVTTCVAGTHREAS